LAITPLSTLGWRNHTPTSDFHLLLHAGKRLENVASQDAGLVLFVAITTEIGVLFCMLLRAKLNVRSPKAAVATVVPLKNKHNSSGNPFSFNAVAGNNISK